MSDLTKNPGETLQYILLLLRVQPSNDWRQTHCQTHWGEALLFAIRLGSSSLHALIVFRTQGTYGFTSDLKDEEIMVKCFARQGFKPTLCWSETPELEFCALNRSAHDTPLYCTFDKFTNNNIYNRRMYWSVSPGFLVRSDMLDVYSRYQEAAF